MKLAFTTLGCTEWDLDTMIARAVEYGYDGIDFRGYMGELEIFKLPEFTTGLDDTLAKFADAGIEVPCLSTSARVYAKPAEAIEEIATYCPLCEKFGAAYIRVFAGHLEDGVSRQQAIDIAVDTLNQAGAIAANHGVTVLLETHDAWVASEHTKAVMDRVDSPAVGILWDTFNPYGAIAEPLAQTWDTLGPWIKNTHWKDGKRTPDGKNQLCLVGQGEFPLADCVKILKSGGYDGYLTLEWEKKWHPELDEPEIAYPEFVRVMKDLL